MNKLCANCQTTTSAKEYDNCDCPKPEPEVKNHIPAREVLLKEQEKIIQEFLSKPKEEKRCAICKTHSELGCFSQPSKVEKKLDLEIYMPCRHVGECCTDTQHKYCQDCAKHEDPQPSECEHEDLGTLEKECVFAVGWHRHCTCGVVLKDNSPYPSPVLPELPYVLSMYHSESQKIDVINALIRYHKARDNQKK